MSQFSFFCAGVSLSASVGDVIDGRLVWAAANLMFFGLNLVCGFAIMATEGRK